MIWYILISLLSVTLLWILLGPVIIYLNTDRNKYYVTLPGIFKAAWVSAGDLFHIRGWIFFIPFKINPFKRRKKKNKEKSILPGKKKPGRRFGSVRMLKGAISSFRIRRLILDIDTDDFSLNAWLVPVFSLVRSENIRMRVNFEGNAFLQLDLRTRISTILIQLIKNR